MALQTRPFDVAEYLTDDETISAYLTDAFENDTPQGIVRALEDVARARATNLSQLAIDAGVSSEEILRLLTNTATADFGTILKIVHALGLKLSASTTITSDEPVAA